MFEFVYIPNLEYSKSWMDTTIMSYLEYYVQLIIKLLLLRNKLNTKRIELPWII